MSVTSSLPPGILLMLPTASDSICSNSFTNQQRLPCSRMPQGKILPSAASPSLLPAPVSAPLPPRTHRLWSRAGQLLLGHLQPAWEPAPPRALRARGRDCLPWVTVGPEPGPALPGRWHTLTRCAVSAWPPTASPRPSSACKFSQGRASFLRSFLHLTHPACFLFPERSAR